MSRQWFGLLCLLCLFLSGCGGGSQQNPPPTKSVFLNQQFTLRVGQQARLEDGLALVLRAVPEDSRCPEDVNCVWEGNATVQVELTQTAPVNPARSVVELHTSPRIGPREGTYLNYVVQLVSLAPNPKSNQTIKAGDYVAGLLVSKK